MRVVFKPICSIGTGYIIKDDEIADPKAYRNQRQRSEDIARTVLFAVVQQRTAHAADGLAVSKCR